MRADGLTPVPAQTLSRWLSGPRIAAPAYGSNARRGPGPGRRPRVARRDHARPSWHVRGGPVFRRSSDRARSPPRSIRRRRRALTRRPAPSWPRRFGSACTTASIVRGPRSVATGSAGSPRPAGVRRRRGRRRIAIRGRPCDGLEDDRLQVARDPRVVMAERPWRVVQDRPDELGPIRTAEGRPQRDHLIKGDTERIDVATGVRAPFEALGSHVAERTNDVACLGQVLPPSNFARPKSATQAVPRESSRRFDGLMSRWSTPRSCACASASATSAPIRATSRW